jgi:hypothetical protein
MKFNVRVTGLEVYHDDIEVGLNDTGDKSAAERVAQREAMSIFNNKLEEALSAAGFKTRDEKTRCYATPVK